MPINTSLLVSAPVLQDAILDDTTGEPLVNGTVTLFQDASRTTLKNWFYQTGGPGAYTFLPLANPLQLNAVGVITDPDGNDTLPFFYPFDESDPTISQPYYITVQDQFGHSKITRQNFPFNPSTAIVNTVNATLNNYITNGVFWRNNGTSPSGINVTSVTSATLAPSIHQGFVTNINVSTSVPTTSSPDITFFKSTTGANDTITFFKMPAGTFLSTTNPQNLDVTPEYYLNLTCAGTGSETFKIVQFPLSLHLKTMDSMPATLTFYARCNGGSNTLTPQIYQFCGTGGSAGIVSPISLNPGTPATIDLPVDAAWHKFEIAFDMPTIPSTVALGNGADDAVFLQFAYPSGGSGVCNIDIAKPCLYVGNQAPTNELATYDHEEAIFNSPRTGDVRTSVNSFYPYGWVPMNNGTIGNTASNATSRKNPDTWPLFYLLWNLAQPYDTGSNSNAICQMFTSAGSATNFGASAIGDFNTNKQLALTTMLGQVIMGTVPVAALLTAQKQVNSSGGNSGGNIQITVASAAAFFTGQPVTFTAGGGSLPDSLVANAVYYITGISGNTFFVATSYANALAGTKVAYGATNGSNFTVITDNTGTTLGQTGTVIRQANFPSATLTGTTIEGLDFNLNPGGTPVTGLAHGGGATQHTDNINLGGSDTPLNVIQPSTFYNIYMKL